MRAGEPPRKKATRVFGMPMSQQKKHRQLTWKSMVAASKQRQTSGSRQHYHLSPPGSSFLLNFYEVLVRRKHQRGPTTVQRRAAFARIRKMPSWRDRVAAVLKKRKRRRQQHGSGDNSDDDIVESAFDNMDEDDDWMYDDSYSPFLADVDTLINRRQIRMTHAEWVETDPLQVMFSDFYKFMGS